MAAFAPGPVLEFPPRAHSLAARVQIDGKRFIREGERFTIQGVTYGPFPPGPGGDSFPAPDRVADDFARMSDIGVNAIRTYHVPPNGFLHLADEAGIAVLVDVPWPKHLCFLDSERARADARAAVLQAAKVTRDHPSVLALSIGNEIPTDVARWHGPRRVERFLRELGDQVKQADPDRLITYANFPPAEYLNLSFLDFITFNVYLHDRETFRRYLFRLLNLVGDKPLLLGELGMDTHRFGESEQAEFLAGHLAEARLMGLAGAFVFSWTDEWHTGGHTITDWAFGITRADRSPKAAHHALRDLHTQSPIALLPRTPRVSVVVCTYNGGQTIGQCLQSLGELDYPDFEVIVVDDGSTDNTADVVQGFPGVRAIRQTNQGLSVARNVGMQAATGEIVAYTDDDCFADPDWLTHLVYQLERTDAAGVGGPNLTPKDGWLASCVAASPGQPTHVLISDQVAEHIPGCNMAFRKEALLAVNGFDPIFRRAGDDVDLCWRLQQSGWWITFAPGAFVWHHRRQSPRSYLKQQAGYGEAEALLYFKHPDQFNARGESRWRGQMYGGSAPGLRVGGPVVYHGTFATGLFQTAYQPGPAHWATLPSTLEWHAAAAAFGLAGILWWPLWVMAVVMLLMSFGVAAALAAQASLPPEADGLRSRLVVAALSYTQPLVRSWRRYKTWLFAFPVPTNGEPDPLDEPVWPGHSVTGSEPGGSGDGAIQSEAEPKPNAPSSHSMTGPQLTGRWTAAYWSEEWRDRTELLNQAIASLTERRWARVIDSGWSNWDLEVSGDRYTAVRVRTVQEEHGGGKRLIRVRYELCPRGTFWLLAGASAVLTVSAAIVDPRLVAAPAIVFSGCLAVLWIRGLRMCGQVARLFDTTAAQMKLIRCESPNAC